MEIINSEEKPEEVRSEGGIVLTDPVMVAERRLELEQLEKTESAAQSIIEDIIQKIDSSPKPGDIVTRAGTEYVVWKDGSYRRVFDKKGRNELDPKTGVKNKFISYAEETE